MHYYGIIILKTTKIYFTVFFVTHYNHYNMIQLSHFTIHYYFSFVPLIGYNSLFKTLHSILFGVCLNPLRTCLFAPWLTLIVYPSLPLFLLSTFSALLVPQTYTIGTCRQVVYSRRGTLCTLGQRNIAR